MKRGLLIYLFIFLFSLQLSQAANYYWVQTGTSSNWADLGNWRIMPGSIVPVTPPQNGDDVFFDANSFPNPIFSPTVNINSAASCRNITFLGGWANNPAIIMGAALDIYGSLTLHTDIDGPSAFTGTLNFEGTAAGLTINTATKKIGTLNFNGIGGGWSLTSPLEAVTVNVVNGAFNTNNHNIILSEYFKSIGSNTRSITLGTSVLDINLGWEVNSTNLTLSANQSTFNFTNSNYVDPAFICGASQVYNNINFISTNATANINGIQSGPGSTFNSVSSSGSVCYIEGDALQFVQVTCANDGEFYLSSSSTIQTLVLSAGKKYLFLGGETLNVTNLSANGNCSGYIELRSTNSSVQAIVNNVSNNTVDQAIIESINMTSVPAPGPNNNATNSIDLGNNTGWTFSAPPVTACYWVGGSGNWNDVAHWAITSGGTPGSACVPTAMNNVIFDNKSFITLPAGPALPVGQTVTINTMAYCNDMIWNLDPAHLPNFQSNLNVPLNIYGSLTLDPTIANFNISKVYFKATSGSQTITSAGKVFPAIYFDGVGGTWSLQDALSGDIYLNSGTLNSNNQNVTGAFRSTTNLNRTFNLGSSLVTANGWTISGNNCTLNLGSSVIDVNGNWNVSGNNFILNAGTSLVRFLNSGSNFTHIASPGRNYYNVEFVNAHQTNAGRLINSGGSFNNIVFLGGGDISGGSFRMNNLTLTAGKKYTLNSNATYTITSSFTANGTAGAGCSTSGYIDISASSPGIQSTIHLPGGNTTIDYCILKDIYATGPGIYTANNSINQGNNTGWVLPPPPAAVSRDLFWVNGTGNWSDPGHWSTTPNGAGGACIPTSIDDVYFTQHSFPVAAQTVTVDIAAECRSMSWALSSFAGAALNTPRFSGGNPLNIYGSLSLINNMIWNFFGDVFFKATTTANTITTANTVFRDVFFDGAGGEWILQDGLRLTSASTLEHKRGILRTNNQTVTVGYFESKSGFARELYLGSSIFTINGSSGGNRGFEITGTNLVLDAGVSEIILNNITCDLRFVTPTLTANRLHDVTFINPGVTNSDLITSGGIVYFHNVKFSGPGNIEGNNNYNKLSFSPGKTYTLESGKTQTVDTLDARGNNCYKIIIQSSVPGTQSVISKSSGNVVCDFLDLKHQNATGGATFLAGQFSINSINNTGWVFNNAPGYIFGLGPDTTIQTCGTNIILSTLNFNATVSTSYTWSTGSTGSSLAINGPGIYWVTATYGPGCSYTDSIVVNVNPALINLQVSPNTSICSGGSVMLTASGGTSYSWSPSPGLSNITGSTIIATPITTTSYTVTTVNGICTDSKIITVTVNNNVITTSTVTICSGQSAMIHGKSETTAGVYSQTFAATGGCDSISDIILVINNSIITSSTVTICLGQSAIIHGNNETTAGVYSQTFIAVGGCDSISDITLIVNVITTNTVTISACNTYTLNGQTYTATGVYTQTLTNSAGCDSVLTLDLTINNTIATTSTVTICSGQSAMIHGKSETTAGVYSQTFVAVGGCDSISDITLMLNNNIITTSTVTICSGQSAMIHGTSQSTAGIYSQTFVATGGCDSISDITLKVNAPSTNTITIVTTNSYFLNGQTYTLTGIYTQILTANNGCDSILTLDLTISNTIHTYSSISVCSPQAAMIHGVNQNVGGIYSQTFVAVGGGDSISTVTLIVNTPTSHTLTIAACDNYTLNGQIYTTTGIYTQTFTNSAGCDSILTLDLTINNAITTSSTVTICSGQSAVIHGNNESTAGIYSQTFVAVGSCDSISIVTLTVNLLPNVTFFSDTNQGCSSLCVNFSTYEPGNYSFAWNFGDNSSSSLLNPSHCYTAEGEYNVQLIVTDANGCTDSLTIVNMITVHPSPVSQFATSVNETTILTPTIAFTDMSIGATSWRWSFGYNLHGTSTEHNPSYTYTDTGSYTIKQTVVNQYGCTDSSEQQITIKAAYAFYIPNAITPNNDGLNDEFIPMSTGMDIGNYELTIYNRWGNLLFKTNDPFQGWNARENSGNIVPQDIYTWKITTRDMFGKSHAYQGSVTVIR